MPTIVASNKGVSISICQFAVNVLNSLLQGNVHITIQTRQDPYPPFDQQRSFTQLAAQRHTTIINPTQQSNDNLLSNDSFQELIR